MPKEEDNVWKEILTSYFREALAFFFPQIHQDIDWNRGYQFLDKELAKILRESKQGQRLADKLVKVYLAGGEEAWLLIHVEVQGYYDREFEERMFIYNYRIFDFYKKEVISLALLTDDSENYRPHSYQRKRWDFKLTMEFPTVKLLDYNKKWAQLEADPSPFAVVVMAHLKARLKAENERFDWKLRLIRMLIERGYSKPEIVKLFRFIDWLVTIPEAMESRFIEEAGKYFEEEQMPYITTPERVGMRKGRHQAALSLVSRLLKRRFGELEPELVQRVSALTADQLEELGEALLDFSQVSDVSDWLNDKGL
jgi:hypothetical protein